MKFIDRRWAEFLASEVMSFVVNDKAKLFRLSRRV
jgi:hypothetical protein